MWYGGSVIPGILAVLIKKNEKISTLQFGSCSFQAVQGLTYGDTSSNTFYKTTVVCISAACTH